MPPESVAATWMLYVVPGARPVREHVADGQFLVAVLPPLMATAVTAYGPRVPGAGDTLTATLVGLVVCMSTLGAPAAEVVTV